MRRLGGERWEQLVHDHDIGAFKRLTGLRRVWVGLEQVLPNDVERLDLT